MQAYCKNRRHLIWSFQDSREAVCFANPIFNYLRLMDEVNTVVVAFFDVSLITNFVIIGSQAVTQFQRKDGRFEFRNCVAFFF